MQLPNEQDAYQNLTTLAFSQQGADQDENSPRNHNQNSISHTNTKTKAEKSI